MKDEIREILDRIETASEIFDCLLKPEECTELLDYITNLQQEIKEANDSITWWTNRFKAVERDNKELKEENERLKQPQIFIDTQDMEERYGEELYQDYLKEQLEDYKTRCEKAIAKIKDLYSYSDNEEYVDNYCKDLLNIL